MLGSTWACMRVSGHCPCWALIAVSLSLSSCIVPCIAAYYELLAGHLPCAREITEQMATSGDVGHPASVLAARFPQLAEQMRELPEVWWPCDPTKPNCALTRKFSTRENKQQLQVLRAPALLNLFTNPKC